MSFSGGEDATVTLYDDSARIQRWMVEISPYPGGPEAASCESERPHPDVKEIDFSRHRLPATGACTSRWT